MGGAGLAASEVASYCESGPATQSFVWTKLSKSTTKSLSFLESVKGQPGVENRLAVCFMVVQCRDS
jgi:hypothetical protein